jgi:hypothetical protein
MHIHIANWGNTGLFNPFTGKLAAGCTITLDPGNLTTVENVEWRR